MLSSQGGHRVPSPFRLVLRPVGTRFRNPQETWNKSGFHDPVMHGQHESIQYVKPSRRALLEGVKASASCVGPAPAHLPWPGVACIGSCDISPFKRLKTLVGYT